MLLLDEYRTSTGNFTFNEVEFFNFPNQKKSEEKNELNEIKMQRYLEQMKMFVESYEREYFSNLFFKVYFTPTHINAGLPRWIFICLFECHQKQKFNVFLFYVMHYACKQTDFSLLLCTSQFIITKRMCIDDG